MTVLRTRGRWLRLIAYLLPLVLAPTLRVSGQVRADPGALINGRVAVRVYVTLSDAETPYAPITDLQLRFFRSATDSVIGRTDDAGALTVLLSPGDYRLVSGAPTTWKGASYTWSIPITVRAGMAALDLTANTAERVASATNVAVTPVAPTAPNSPPSPSAPSAPRDAVWTAALHVLADRSLVVKSSDKSAGVITTEETAIANEDRRHSGKCGDLLIPAWPVTAEYTVTITGDTAAVVHVSSHLPWRSNNGVTVGECQTSRFLESRLEHAIAERAR
jgi:hypothetical protein